MTLSDIVIIAEDASLAEHACSFFRAARKYIVVLEIPVRRLERYGVYQNDCIHVSNMVRAINPKYVLILGDNNAVVDEIDLTFLGPEKVIRAPRFDRDQFAFLPGLRPSATSANLWNSTRSSANTVVVESGDPMARVIAENLAVAHSAAIFIAPEVTEQDVDTCADYLRDWAEQTGLERENAKTRLLQFVRDRIGELANATVDSITFVTRGIPYGIHPFDCPTTHLFTRHLLGPALLTGILKSKFNAFRCPVAILVDPGLTGGSEFEALTRTFAQRGYLVRRADGERASVTECRYLTEHLPCDFIFYSTHCGERRGRRITEAFVSSDGVEHRITYDVLRDAAASPTSGMVEVHHFYRWLTIDGIRWQDFPTGVVHQEFFDFVREHGGNPAHMRILNSVVSPPIRASDSLQMHDGVFIPLPRTVGGYHFPIVFNNACSTWRELASRYAGAGAAVYIGTSLPVLNSLAIEVTTNFGRAVASGRVISRSLYQAQRSFIQSAGYTPYLMHGYQYTQCTPPPARLLRGLLVMRKLKIAVEQLSDCDEDERSRRQAILDFVAKEIAGLAKGGTLIG